MKTLKEIAIQAIQQQPESYYKEPFEPHDWVLSAIRLGRCLLANEIAKMIKGKEVDVDGCIKIDRDGIVNLFREL